MNMIETAKELGFSGAAVIDTAELVFIPEYRVFCEENLCGNYDLNPACPPESGTVEEMKAHALTYEKRWSFRLLRADRWITKRQSLPTII